MGLHIIDILQLYAVPRYTLSILGGVIQDHYNEPLKINNR